MSLSDQGAAVKCDNSDFQILTVCHTSENFYFWYNNFGCESSITSGNTVRDSTLHPEWQFKWCVVHMTCHATMYFQCSFSSGMPCGVPLWRESCLTSYRDCPGSPSLLMRIKLFTHTPIKLYVSKFFFLFFFYEWEHRTGTMCPFSSLHHLGKGKERQWKE